MNQFVSQVNPCFIWFAHTYIKELVVTILYSRVHRNRDAVPRIKNRENVPDLSMILNNRNDTIFKVFPLYCFKKYVVPNFTLL